MIKVLLIGGAYDAAESAEKEMSPLHEAAETSCVRLFYYTEQPEVRVVQLLKEVKAPPLAT